MPLVVSCDSRWQGLPLELRRSAEYSVLSDGYGPTVNGGNRNLYYHTQPQDSEYGTTAVLLWAIMVVRYDTLPGDLHPLQPARSY